MGAGGLPAWSAEPGPDTLPITVIAIQPDDADDQAEALTKALRAAVRASQGWSLDPSDNALEVLTLSLKCAAPPDANCQSRIADQIKSDRFVWGTLKHEKKNPNVVGEVHLWVRGKGTSNWPLNYTANLTEANEDALKKIANDAFSALTGGPPKGSIHVRAGTVAGQVFVDGQPIGALKNGEGTFSAPAGARRVTVKAIGYADAESQVVIKAGARATEVAVTLVERRDAGAINWKRIGGFTALGVGVVFAAVGIASSAQVASVNNDAGYTAYRNMLSTGNSDVCAAAAPGGTLPNSAVVNQCNKGKMFQTLQIASYPIAAIAGGVGIFLIATSGRSAPRTGSVKLDPQVGPGVGKLDLSYTW
jgi:hypothetical protein